MAEKREATQEKLRKAVLELYKERGFINVTIKDICQRAGCSEGTFYYHFKSMQGLLDSLHDWQLTITTDLLLEVMTLSSPWEKLWRIHRAFIDVALSVGSELYWSVYFQSSPNARAARIESFQGINKFIMPIIREGQACGEIRNPTPPELLCTTVGLTMQGICYDWYLHNGETDLEAEMRQELANLYGLRDDLR